MVSVEEQAEKSWYGRSMWTIDETTHPKTVNTPGKTRGQYMPTEREVTRMRQGHSFVPVGLWPSGLWKKHDNQMGDLGGPCTNAVWMVADGYLWWGDFHPEPGGDGDGFMKTAHMQLHHALPPNVQGRVECAGSVRDGELRYNSMYNCDELRIWCCNMHMKEIGEPRGSRARETLIQRFEQCRMELRDKIMEGDYHKECSEEDKIIVQLLWDERIKVD